MYEKKSFFPIFVIGFILVILIINFGFGGYHSTDSRSDGEVKEYLVNYMKEKYGIDCDLTLTYKELARFCIGGSKWSIDGSCVEHKNEDIYLYRFDGVDSDGTEFYISYTNSYRYKNKEYDFSIHENYDDNSYKNDNKIAIQNVLINNGYKNSKVYNLNGKYNVIIYDKDFDKFKLVNLVTRISSITDEYSIFIVDEYEEYNWLLEEGNTELHRLSYDYAETNNAKYYDTSEFLNLIIDERGYGIVVSSEYSGRYNVMTYSRKQDL